jgi:selenide,water dikinase
VLRQLPPITDPNVLIGAATSDDAAVYRINDDLAMAVTVDFFTPVVDDPYDFGRIAAANSLSDLYAMGATPALALNLVGFPSRSLPMEILGEIVRGGAAIASEAGCAIIGGHTIDDEEPKYGLVCIGFAHPSRITANIGAQAGDRLVLTKPLGIGILATAIKRGRATPSQIEAAVRTMTTLNKAGADAIHAIQSNSGTSGTVHAVTDVTGFGLLGHVSEMAGGSGVGVRLWASAIPILDGVVELAADDVVPGGTRRNAEWLGQRIMWEEGVPEPLRWAIYDAQTSGGLLVSVAPEAADALIAELESRGTLAAAVIGEITADSNGSISVMR